MNLFGKRPLALFCVSFALASIGGCYLTLKHIELHLPLAILLFLSAALLLAVPLFRHRFHAKILTPIIALFFAALALVQSWYSIGNKLKTITSFDAQEATCRMIIKEKYFSKSYLSSYRAKIETLNGKPLNVMGEVSLPSDTDWESGDVIVGNFTIYSTNENTENTLYRISDGILLELEGEEQSASIVDHMTPDRLAKALSDLRNTMSNIISDLITGEEGNLVSSLFLNKRELLNDQTTLAFRRTGTTHLLAISGMHLSIIIFLVENLLRAFCVKKNSRCVIMILISLFYLTLTGFALSACRAFLMCCFVYLAWLLRSDNDVFTSLCFSLFFMLVISPYSVCDIGMWMSVLAVLGILIAVYFLDILRDGLKKKGVSEKSRHWLISLISSVSISLAAELFILFPMWLVFDELSLVALPCGLLLSPLVTAVLFLTPLLLVVSWVPFLSSLLGSLLYGICHIMLEAVSAFSTLHGITVSLGYRFFSIIIPLFSLLLAILLVVKLKRKWPIPVVMGGTILSVALFLLFLRVPATDMVTTDFWHQNENEFLIFSAAEKSVICDVSDGNFSALRSTYEILRERNSTEISAYILTHYHTRHVLSLPRLFSSFIVDAIYLPVPQNEDESAVFIDLITLAKQYGITTVIYDRGTPIFMETLSLTVSNAMYLNRSSQPTFYITVTAFEQTLLYVSESAHENQRLYEEICQQIQYAEYIFLGSHGPTTKQSFSYPLGTGYVFLTDNLLLEHFSPQNIPTGKVVCECTHVSFSIQKDDKN